MWKDITGAHLIYVHTVKEAMELGLTYLIVFTMNWGIYQAKYSSHYLHVLKDILHELANYHDRAGAKLQMVFRFKF